MEQPPPDHHLLAHTHNYPAIYTSSQSLPSPKDCFRCCALIIILAYLISGATYVAFLFIWLGFGPQQMRIVVTSASLSHFNLTSPSTSDSFDLTTNLTFRNPSKWANNYYDWLEAKAAYDEMHCTCAVELPDFYQGLKETTEVTLVLKGCSMIGKCGGGGEFERDNATDVFLVDLWIFGRVRYKFGFTETKSNAFRAFCPLRVPLGKAGFSFTDCKVSINNSN